MYKVRIHIYKQTSIVASYADYNAACDHFNRIKEGMVKKHLPTLLHFNHITSLDVIDNDGNAVIEWDRSQKVVKAQ